MLKERQETQECCNIGHVTAVTALYNVHSALSRESSMSLLPTHVYKPSDRARRTYSSQQIRPNESTYTQRLENSWAKLDKYYQRTDDTAAYRVALILDPRIKMKYFERNWATKQEWIIEAEEKMRQIYHEYKGMEDQDLEVNYENDSEDISFNIEVLRFGRPERRKDELIRYLTSDTVIVRQKNFDLIEWWKANESEYPILARIAFDILSIPCMSVEPERAFSG